MLTARFRQHPVSRQARDPRANEPSPFLELERLIDAGFDRDSALSLMAIRRDRAESGRFSRAFRLKAGSVRLAG